MLKYTMKSIKQLNIKYLGSLFYKGLKENHVRIMNGPATVIGERSFNANFPSFTYSILVPLIVG